MRVGAFLHNCHNSLKVKWLGLMPDLTLKHRESLFKVSIRYKRKSSDKCC